MNYKYFYIILLFLSFLYGCKSTCLIHFQSDAPCLIESPYYQPWSFEVQGRGSGIDVVLPIKNLNAIVPDSLHLRGQRVKAVYKNKMIVGHISTTKNQHQDIILSNEPLAEVGNQLLPIRNNSPFELPDNVCVLSYIIDDKRFYYKITDLIQLKSSPYP